MRLCHTTALRRLCTLALCLGATCTWAHKGSDAYLDVQQIQVMQIAAPQIAQSTGRNQGTDAPQRAFKFVLAVALKDLDLVLPLDANADGKVTWGEVKAVMPQVVELLNQSANLPAPATSPAPPSAEPGCRLRWQSDGLERRSDGTYLRMAAQATCPAGQPLAFHYTLFKDQDASHRLLVAGRIGDTDLLTTTSPQQTSALVLGGAASAVAVTPSVGGAASTAAEPVKPPSNAWSALRDYFNLGVHHLLEGYDHMAFLLALVLPLQLVLFGAARRTLPAVIKRADNQVNVWWALLRTITAFTIGHSITLMLATFGLTQASPAWVEPAIAFSIGFTAFLNLRPTPWIRTDVLALLFGLVHGYGFAGLLLEAAAPTGLLPWALAGFNLGVEAGQLIVVGAWVLLSQPLAGQRWYPQVVVRGGSGVLILLATYWFWQRLG